MARTKRLIVAMGATALGFCLFFSGCVLYPKDDDSQGKDPNNEDPGGFPQTVNTALLSSGVPPFDAPPEIVGLKLDLDYSDYTSSGSIFLLSYTGANQKQFDDYTSYLLDTLGYYVDKSGEGYSCYEWFVGDAGIELGFSSRWIGVADFIAEAIPISVIPSNTLYLLIVIY
jgi:hypothetical protein